MVIHIVLVTIVADLAMDSVAQGDYQTSLAFVEWWRQDLELWRWSLS